MKSKRRLPVVPSSGDFASGETRPDRHWIGFGAAAIVACWLLLTSVAEALAQSMIERLFGPLRSPDAAQAATAALTPTERTRLMLGLFWLHLLALAGGAFAGGYLIGRWGGAAGVRDAALAGLCAAVAVGTLTLASRGLGIGWAPLAVAVLAVVVVAVGAAVLGARRGLRRRATR